MAIPSHQGAPPMTDKLLLALAATVLALTIAVASTPPGGKSDALKTYRPAEASACNVG